MTDLLVEAALRAAAAMAAPQDDSAHLADNPLSLSSLMTTTTTTTVYGASEIDLVRLGVLAIGSTAAAAVSAVTAFGMAVTFHAIVHGVAAIGLAAIDMGAAVAYLMCMAIPAFWPWPSRTTNTSGGALSACSLCRRRPLPMSAHCFSLTNRLPCCDPFWVSRCWQSPCGRPHAVNLMRRQRPLTRRPMASPR